jgi:hypothetical protein
MLTMKVENALAALRADRALATSEADLAALDAQIARAHRLYVAAAVTDIATFRAELSGPQVG